jgi:hypothetical protein
MLVDPQPTRDQARDISLRQVRTLDEERAASMADEGGVSGAYMDAVERGEISAPGTSRRMQAPAWLPLALAVTGAFLLGRYTRGLLA